MRSLNIKKAHLVAHLHSKRTEHTSQFRSSANSKICYCDIQPSIRSALVLEKCQSLSPMMTARIYFLGGRRLLLFQHVKRYSTGETRRSSSSSHPVTSSKLIFSFPHLNPLMSFRVAENGDFTRASITSVSVARLSSAGALAAFSIGESARDLRLASVDDVTVRRMRITTCDGDKMPNCRRGEKEKSFLALVGAISSILDMLCESEFRSDT